MSRRALAMGPALPGVGYRAPCYFGQDKHLEYGWIIVAKTFPNAALAFKPQKTSSKMIIHLDVTVVSLHLWIKASFLSNFHSSFYN